jgi:hypothetical protein
MFVKIATLFSLAASFALFPQFVGVANAQFTSGAVEGYVKDSSGAVIPGAEVTVTDENLGLERKITSNETGLFRIGELSAGAYEVSVTSEGFQTWSTTGLLVRSDETRTLYPKLEVGEVTTSVTVAAETSAVNTSEVDNSNFIAEESIRNQPLPRNTIWQLSTLVPGVTGSGETSGTNGAFVDNYQGEMGLKINASGQRQGSKSGHAERQLCRGALTRWNHYGQSDPRLTTGISGRGAELLRVKGTVIGSLYRAGHKGGNQ